MLWLLIKSFLNTARLKMTTEAVATEVIFWFHLGPDYYKTLTISDCRATRKLHEVRK